MHTSFLLCDAPCLVLHSLMQPHSQQNQSVEATMTHSINTGPLSAPGWAYSLCQHGVAIGL